MENIISTLRYLLTKPPLDNFYQWLAIMMIKTRIHNSSIKKEKINL